MRRGDTGQTMIQGIMVEWRCVDAGYPASRGDYRGDDPAEPPTLEMLFGNDGGIDEIDMDRDEIEALIIEEET